MKWILRGDGMSDFAANLKQFRKRKNYSQATLAKKLNEEIKLWKYDDCEL